MLFVTTFASLSRPSVFSYPRVVRVYDRLISTFSSALASGAEKSSRDAAFLRASDVFLQFPFRRDPFLLWLIL